MIKASGEFDSVGFITSCNSHPFSHRIAAAANVDNYVVPVAHTVILGYALLASLSRPSLLLPDKRRLKTGVLNCSKTEDRLSEKVTLKEDLLLSGELPTAKARSRASGGRKRWLVCRSWSPRTLLPRLIGSCSASSYLPLRQT